MPQADRRTLPPARILVTDGETRAALAAVRALGSRGHTVHVAAPTRRSLAGASRHAASEHAIGDPSADPAGWAAALERVAADVGAALLFPLTEVSLGNVYAFDVDTRWDVVGPERGAYERATDKQTLLQRAEALGLDVPRTHPVASPSSLSALPESFRYPAVLKARRSRFLDAGRWIAGDARVLQGEEDLRAAASDPGFRDGALLQEYVPGHGEAIFALADRGRVLVPFAHRRIREKPPTGGVSVLRESIAPDPRLLDQSERLLADLGFSGAAMVEFRRAPDGRAVLMEINPRLWGSLQLAVDAGVDFASLWVSLHRGETVEPVEPRLGVRTRWLRGDLDHLWISLRRRSVRELTGRSVPALFGDFFRSFFDGSRTEVLRRDDWRPFLRELSRPLS